MRAFIAYGRCIESDFFFDTLPGTERTEDSISIHVQRVDSIEQDLGSALRPCTAQGRSLHIVFHESYVTVQVELLLSFEFWLSLRQIKCSVVQEITDGRLQYWILQQILPLYFLLNGSTEFLHGMAVSSLPWSENLSCNSNGTSMAFLGESYAGKSTLLKYFLARGHLLVADDHLALSREDCLKVFPATPSYRPYRAPEDLGIQTTAYSPKPCKLQRVYLLRPAPADTSPRICSIAGINAITALFSHIHYGLYNAAKPDFFPLVEDRFRGLADLVRRVPIAHLDVPRSFDRLPEVYDFIQANSAELSL